MCDENIKPPKQIPLSVLLKKDHRNREGTERFLDIARKLGVEVTSKGNASLAIRVDEETFVRLFGEAVPSSKKHEPSESDFGSSLGYQSQICSIPDAMQPIVELISVVEPAIRMAKPNLNSVSFNERKTDGKEKENNSEEKHIEESCCQEENEKKND